MSRDTPRSPARETLIVTVAAGTKQRIRARLGAFETLAGFTRDAIAAEIARRGDPMTQLDASHCRLAATADRIRARLPEIAHADPEIAAEIEEELRGVDQDLAEWALERLQGVPS